MAIRSAVLVSLVLALVGCGAASVGGASEDASQAVTSTGCGLKAGQTLATGHIIGSCGNKYILAMQGDGNLVLYVNSPRVALWASNTSGTGSANRAVMQGDGNLVVYTSRGKAVWNSKTNGNPGAGLALQTDGNLVVYSRANKALWDAGAAPADVGPNGINAGTTMKNGTVIYSHSKAYKLQMQSDGNLVLYQGKTAKWETSTHAGGNKTTASMQWDGNLVLRDGAGKALWSTGSQGHTGGSLAVQDNGQLIVYTRAWQPAWTAKNNVGGGGTTAPPVTVPPPSSGTITIPAALVSQLSVKPYVEESCTAVSATSLGWPYAAKRCSYDGKYSVTVADPDASRVAAWIVDSASMIPALAGLQKRDPGNWERGLAVIANNTLMQSGRIFPLDGTVAEDGYPYQFHHGVTSTCSTGCYCRVNSTSRPEWCHYAAAAYGTSYSSCIAQFGSSTLKSAWEDHCLNNHISAWNSNRNDDYRARAWNANQGIASEFPNPSTASGPAVVQALKDYFGS